MSDLIKRISVFLRETIWFERRETRRVWQFLRRLLQVSFLVGKGFLDNKCFLRASALSYTALLSLVPLLAFAFSILKGLGVEAEEPLRVILTRVSAGQQEVVEKIVTYVSSYIAKTNVKALGVLGLLTLLYTVVKVLSTVENTFNDIWGLKSGRRWLRKLADYTSVMVIAPVLMVAAVGLSTYLLANPLLGSDATITAWGLVGQALAKMGPYVLTWIALGAFYAFMPNTQVSFSSALGGGIVGGTLWQGAFWGYTKYQISAASNLNAVYTSFAALPVFLVWLYISWVVVLFGAEVAFAIGHLATYRRDAQRFSPSLEGMERAALRVFLEIAKAFHIGAAAPSAEMISRSANLPVRAVREITGILIGEGLAAEVVCKDKTCYHPGRELSQITLGSVLASVRAHGDEVGGAEGDALWAETTAASGMMSEVLGREELSRSVADVLAGLDEKAAS